MSAPPKVPQPKAPELGAFPLDHFRECSDKIKEYFTCLERENHLAPKCRDETRNYLECRMEKGLMVKQDVKKFGLPQTSFVETRSDMKRAIREAKSQGIVEFISVVEKIDQFTGADGYELESTSKTTQKP